MNDAFAARVYPTILYVLDLLDRIGKPGNEPSPRDELPALKQCLGQLDSRGSVDEKDYELAKRALVYWIDEVLVNSSWSYAGQWKDRILEHQLYATRNRATDFFEYSKTARTLGRSDALEVYYLCVAMGFLGTFRDGEHRAGNMRKTVAEGKAPPAPAPKEKGAEVTWFGDGGGAGADLGMGQTWGGTPGSGPAFGAGGGGVLGGAASSSSRSLPPSLQEWASPILAQICPKVAKTFQPSASPDSQRDARPLSGSRNLERAGTLVGLMTLVTIGLGCVWYFV